jgi:hypothetical protein
MSTQKNKTSPLLIIISTLTILNFVMFSVNQTPAFGGGCSFGQSCFPIECWLDVFLDCEDECNYEGCQGCMECTFMNGDCDTGCMCQEVWECECEDCDQGDPGSFYVECEEENEFNCDPAI